MVKKEKNLEEKRRVRGTKMNESKEDEIENGELNAMGDVEKEFIHYEASLIVNI